ncbi:MAG: hypothetical protein JW843_13020, partial [Candidatus Aminicenantes bacterium]|nr:hypothetical protein [Candidatus Aminicenantes bacterium]
RALPSFATPRSQGAPCIYSPLDSCIIQVKIEGRTISFTIPDAPGPPVVRGTLDETGRRMSGTIFQNEMDGIFRVEKIIDCPADQRSLAPSVRCRPFGRAGISMTAVTSSG